MKFTISTKTDNTLQTSVKKLRAITMCSAITPDCGYDNGTIVLIGDVYCPNTKCLGKLCPHKRLFSLLAEAIINVRIVGLCFRCTIFLLKIKQIPFSCRLVKGFTFLKGVQKQFKMFLEMSIVLASIVPTERNVNLVVVFNNSEIHLCLWKVWSLVVCLQSSFYVTRARKDNRNRQNTFFLC